MKKGFEIPIPPNLVAFSLLMTDAMSLHIRFFRRIIALIAISSTITHTTANANDEPPPQTDDKKAVQRIEKIIVKDNHDVRRDETTGKIVVTADEITKFGDTQFTDVLRRVPGVTVIGSDIRMRGLGSGYTQILLNGEQLPPGFSLDSLSPDLVERIEIIRSATAEYSTQAIAGTINIILKRKVSSTSRELKTGLSTGKGYKSPNISLTASDKDGGFSYSFPFNLSYIDSDITPRSIQTGEDGNGQQILRQEWSARTLRQFTGGGTAPRLNWTLQNGDTITMQSFVNLSRNRSSGDTEYSLIRGTAPVYPKLLSTTATETGVLRTDVSRSHGLADDAKFEWKIGLNCSNRITDFRQQGYDQNLRENLDSSVISSAREIGALFTGKYSTTLTKGHSLVAGWDAGILRRRETRDQRDKALLGIVPFVSLDDYDLRVVRAAFFAQDEWNFTNEWSAYAGLRWEGLSTKSDGNTFASVKNNSIVLSPIFQTLYKIPERKGEQVRMALTRTFKAPSAGSLIPRLFTSANNSPTDPDTKGNPNLRPELATGLDAAYEKFWGQGAAFSLATAFRQIRDSTRKELQFINGRWISSSTNDGTARTASIEFDSKFPVQSLYNEAPPIDFRFNVSRNWSRVDSVPGPNSRLSDQIPVSANLGLDYRLRGGEFVVGGNFGFRGGGPVRTGINTASYFSLRRELDIYGLWKLNSANQLRFTIGNLFRMDYLNQTTYSDSFGRIQKNDSVPSSVYARLNWEIKL